MNCVWKYVVCILNCHDNLNDDADDDVDDYDDDDEHDGWKIFKKMNQRWE